VDIWSWMNNLVATHGYSGAFIISLFGNFTVFFPVPYVVTIYAFGAKLNPLLLGTVCGVGSTIGEFTAYLIGRGGRTLLNDKYGEQLENAKMLIQKYGMAVIFFFAVMPLPDDLILIPLGILRYDLRRAIVAMLLGKLLMCIGVAYAGKYSYSFIKNIFASSGWMGGIVSTVLLALTIYALLKVDWTKLVDERMGKMIKDQ